LHTPDAIKGGILDFKLGHHLGDLLHTQLINPLVDG
jgi:hypothetical protein